MERQYRIVKPNATKEEIDEAFDSGSQQPELFTQQVPGHPPWALPIVTSPGPSL